MTTEHNRERKKASNERYNKTRKDRDRLYYLKNRDAILFKQKNDPKRKERRKKYEKNRPPRKYKDRREYYREYWKTYKNTEKAKRKAKKQRANRRAREKGVPGKIDRKEWLLILKKYNYTCLCCGRTNIEITLDHINPISLGGPNMIENAQPLCRSCNSHKGIKRIDYRPA